MNRRNFFATLLGSFVAALWPRGAKAKIDTSVLYRAPTQNWASWKTYPNWYIEEIVKRAANPMSWGYACGTLFIGGHELEVGSLDNANRLIAQVELLREKQRIETRDRLHEIHRTFGRNIASEHYPYPA